MARLDAGDTAGAAASLEAIDAQSARRDESEGWRGLSRQRLGELRGHAVSPWKISVSGQAAEKLVAPSPPAHSFDLPAQLVMECPAQLLQSLAWPSTDLPNRIVFHSGDNLACVDAKAAKLCWERSDHKTTRPYGPPLWLGNFDPVAVSADAHELRGFSIVDGRLLWSHEMPLRPVAKFALSQREPVRLPNPFPQAAFSLQQALAVFHAGRESAHRAGPAGRQHRVGLLGARRPDSSYGGGGPVSSPLLRRRPVPAAANDGRQMPGAGQLNRQEASRVSSAAPWVEAPLRVDGQRFAMGGAAGQVSVLDAANGAVLWTFQPPGHTSLTGSCPQLLGNKKTLLASVPKNIGTDLVCLNPENGLPLWNVPLLPDEPESPKCGTRCRRDLFCLQESPPGAFSRGWQVVVDGEVAWRFRGLEGCGAGACLLAWPQEGTQLSWLSFYPSPLTCTIGYQVWTKPVAQRSLLALDPVSGQCVQRSALGEGRGPIAVQLGDNHLAAMVAGKLQIFRSLAKD